MCALSPPCYANFGWPIECRPIHDPRDCFLDDPLGGSYNCRAAACESLFRFSPSPPEAEVAAAIVSGGDASTVKKLCHNANERDRRKKLNELYSSLRSLLPGADHTKKLSIPATVSRVLKYIPELQREVERLTQRKEELLSRMPHRGEKTHLGNRPREPPPPPPPFPTVVQVSKVGDSEVVAQICAVLESNRSTLSRVLRHLEEEDLRLLNISSFAAGAAVGGRIVYNLHLQTRETLAMDSGLLREKLLTLYRDLHDHLI